ncbi:MAG: hypothetical protein KDA80_08120 [Planctomycetaceae bacterium]|nr:hypothetical protein [Planctomycetaceae bacterium]
MLSIPRFWRRIAMGKKRSWTALDAPIEGAAMLRRVFPMLGRRVRGQQAPDTTLVF